MENVLENAYTARDFDYLKSKGLDVAIVVRDRDSEKVSVRSNIPVVEVLSLLKKEYGSSKKDNWVTPNQRMNFPKSPGPLREILANKSKLQKFASKVMFFWSGVRGGKAMGVGEFPAWDTFELDIGKVELHREQFDKLNTYSLRMSNVIEWINMKGLHGIGTGNLKAVKVDWEWVEVLRCIIIWSYAVLEISIEENVNETWSPGADDFEEVLPKKRFNPSQTKTKATSTKKQCTAKEKEEGRKKGIQRAKANLFKPRQDDFQMAVALSVSEEIEKERSMVRDQEDQDLAKAMSLSLTKRGGESVERGEVTQNIPAER